MLNISKILVIFEQLFQNYINYTYIYIVSAVGKAVNIKLFEM